MPFGATLRLLRIDAGLSLRGLARQIGVSSAYLSRVENGHDAAPTPDRLADIAHALGVPPALMLSLADQVDPYVGRYLEEVPAAGALFLEIARRRLTGPQLARVRAFVESEFGAPAAPRAQPISRLLTPERVMLRVECADLGDAIDLAVSRLGPARPDLRPAQIAQAVRAREAEASTALGGGVCVPHALLMGVQPAAVLLTLVQPLPLDTPDGAPIRVVVVLVSDAPGHTWLGLLAQLARMASSELPAALGAATSPDGVLDAVRRWEMTYIG